MCGICGIAGREPVDGELLRSMTDSLRHRGPDSEGAFLEGGIGLGVRRLSIIDLAGGDQPIANEDGSVVVVQNGEIYNFLALRERLIAEGHTFRTHSDTEVLVHLYEQHGDGFPTHLEGMFALAIYDRPRRRLLLARDRMGKKPLYYARTGRGLLFGSEVKPLLLADPSLRETSPGAVRLFFRFGFVPEPATIYPRVYKLPPGSTMVFDGSEPGIHRYWDLNFEPDEVQDREAYVDELDALLQEAVRRRLISEVPLGAFLSGGPDSSLITAYMTRLLGRPVPTFTIAFREQGYDESSAAALVSRHLGTAHQVKLLSREALRDSLFEDVEAIVRHTDEPIGDSSALPTYHVCRLAREGVKVILGGDGADEVFAGYTLFQGLKFALLYQKLPPWMRRGMIQPLCERWAGARPPGEPRWAAQAWCKRLSDSNLPLPELLASKFALTREAVLSRLFPGLVETGAVGQPPLSGANAGVMEQAQYAVARFQQVNDMLVKIDRMSMAHSLEMRSPYLDHHVVEFAARLPFRYKLRGWEGKSILRRLAARYLPRSSARKKKHGFGVPISLWFRDGLRELLTARLRESPGLKEYVDVRGLERVLEEHRRGEWDHGQLLWCLLTFDAWHRIYVRGD